MTIPHVAMQQDLQANGKKTKLAEPVVGSWGGLKLPTAIVF